MMTRFAPVRSRLLAAHFFAAFLLLVSAGAGAVRLFAYPPDPIGAAALVLLVVALVCLPAVVYRLIFLFSAGYEIAPAGSLTVRFGRRQETLPLEEIEEIHSGGKIPEALRKSAPGWLHMWQGRRAAESEEPVDWLATDRGSNLLLLITPSRRLAVSPADPAGFARKITELCQLGSLEKIEPVSLQPAPLLLEIIRDLPAIGLISSGLAGATILAAYLVAVQPGLPPDQAFRFDPSGIPTSPGSPLRLLILPTAGGMVWLANTLIGWWAWRKVQRPAAYTLWAVSLIVVIGLWGASVALLAAR
jgi:hypothetical protein